MRRHVEQLTADLPVAPGKVKRLHQPKALRDPGSGEVLELQLPAIRSESSYATALHEIGHARGRHQQSRARLTRERWAWQWAHENALIWTDAMERARIKALAWYEAKARKPKARKARKGPRTKQTRIEPAIGSASGRGTAKAVGAAIAAAVGKASGKGEASAVGTAIAAAVGVAKVTAPKKGRGRPRKDSTIAGLKLLQENPSVHGAAKRTATSTGESSEQIRSRLRGIKKRERRGG